MKLADLSLPIPYADAQAYALVFDVQLAARLAELHAAYGSGDCVPVPRVMTDGRLLLCADLLSEIGPGGLLHEVWQHADHQVIAAAVEVMPWAEASPLLPTLVAEPEQAAIDQAFREASTL